MFATLLFSNGFYISHIEAVANTFYSLFTKWPTSGPFIGKWHPGGVAIDSSSHKVYVADTGNNRIHTYLLADSCPTGTVQVVSGVCLAAIWGGPVNKQFDGPSGIAIDSATHEVYVSDIGNNWAHKFLLADPCPSGTTQVATGVCYVTTWYGGGSADTKFSFPSDIAVDSSTHEVYVADTNHHRIQKFLFADPCPSGTTPIIYEFSRTQIFSGVCFVKMWGCNGFLDGCFQFPFSVAVDSSTHAVYVADTFNNRIQKFTKDGTFVTKWWTSGTTNGQFKYPQGVEVDSSGRVYVADTVNNRIHKFLLSATCPTGTTQVATGVCRVTSWGSTGMGDAHFNNPNAVAVDSLGHVYVSDWGNYRIQVFVWKNLLQTNNQFQSPH